MKKVFIILIIIVLGSIMTPIQHSFASAVDGRFGERASYAFSNMQSDLSRNYSSIEASEIKNNHVSFENSLTDTSTPVEVSVMDSVLLRKLMYDMEVHFRLDRCELDGSYMGNDVAFRQFYDMVQSIGWDRIDSIEIVSYASPEGAYERNMWLSHERSQAMRRYIDDEYPELSSRLTVHAGGESWALLAELVKSDTRLTAVAIDEILSVIYSDVDVASKKLRMQQLPDYDYLLSTYYPVIRKSMLCVVYFHESRISGYLVATPARISTPEAAAGEPARVALSAPAWSRYLYLKTNAVAWGMGISNIAVEVDIVPHWSVSLPVYYSAWNYFSETVKFRTFALQPEARYWLRGDNVGFYVGGHLSMAYYNFAFGGDIRYQDHDGCSPAWGGGLNVGYRLPISKNDRWHLEFNLGAGVHSLYYDTFHNTPSTKDGRLIDTYRDTYWGIDQVGITFTYRIDLSKKGGRR